MFRLFVFSLICLGAATGDVNAAIKNLVGEPDYRKVRLYWNAAETPTNGFQVKYCELQSWGTQRCRTKFVKEPTQRSEDSNDDLHTYETEVDGLRMATTYSFEVKQGGREDRSDDKNQNLIVIPTKGFSAKATQCLPQVSEIEVSTGPYFGGRIAVEAADGERCGLDGDAESSNDTYTLRIDHQECGSLVNDTTVSTFVLVQENLPILTHSTRRFLVLCTFQPETLTVRAGLSLPSGARGQASVAYEDASTYSRRSRNMRIGRVLEKPEALVGQNNQIPSAPPSGKSNILPVTLIVLLMVAGVAGLVAVSLRWNMRQEVRDLDSVSVQSDISVSSTSTTVEAEVSETTSQTNEQQT